MEIMDKYVQTGEALAEKENEVVQLTKQVLMTFISLVTHPGRQRSDKGLLLYLPSKICTSMLFFFLTFFIELPNQYQIVYLLQQYLNDRRALLVTEGTFHGEGLMQLPRQERCA